MAEALRSPGAWRLLLLAGGVLLAVGCGGKGEKVVEVTGKVTVDDQPMSMGLVTFHPDKSKGNDRKDTAVGNLQTDGTYKLNYKGKLGAPPGWYKVSVSPKGMPAEMPTAGQPMPKPMEIPSKYQNPERSKIAIEVKEGAEAGAYDIKIEKK